MKPNISMISGRASCQGRSAMMNRQDFARATCLDTPAYLSPKQPSGASLPVPPAGQCDDDYPAQADIQDHRRRSTKATACRTFSFVQVGLCAHFKQNAKVLLIGCAWYICITMLITCCNVEHLRNMHAVLPLRLSSALPPAKQTFLPPLRAPLHHEKPGEREME